MRKTTILMLGLTLVTSAAFTAPKKAKKPAKPTAKPSTRAVKGTTQMAGDNGKIGITYTLGKGDDCINFTLNRAEYSIEPLKLDNQVFPLEADKKWLLLHYSVQNPNKSEYTYNWATLKFTAVNSENVNCEGSGNIMKAGTSTRYDVRLKPAQKVDVWTAIELSAKASVPKIIVQRGDYQPVLRLYFAKDGIKGLPAPFADPADATGCIARTTVPAEAGTYYPGRQFDVKYVDCTYTDQALGDKKPDDGKQFYIANMMLRNSAQQKWTFNWATFVARVKTDDGEWSRMLSNTVLKSKRNEVADSQPEPGEEYPFRLIIEIPKDAKVTDLELSEGETSRKYAFKVK